MQVVRQGISQIKTPYNFSRINSDIRKPDDLKMKAEFLKKETKLLNISAKKVTLDLFKILPNIRKLLTLPPIRDDKLLNRGQYRKRLWEYLNDIKEVSEFQYFHGTLEVNENPSSGASDQVSIKIMPSSPTVYIISYLLTLEKKEKLTKRKEVIKNLTSHIWCSIKSQDKDRALQDIARRRLLRFHVTILQSIRKLEMVCVLKPRKKNETIKSQAVRKIIKRSDGRLMEKSLTLIIQWAHRIEWLLNLAEDDWRLLDVYEELIPCFFTSTINSCYNFKIFLELVKSNTIISSDDVKKRYENWKKRESILRAEQFNDACEQAGINIQISSENLE
jgi:hypothetical protein